ncbi:hypothetical protein [Klebsiella oxytoca]|uniref:hypothetical protein n=1 Tax=Klebsiella oxytoca TaxID=571 RepID=UPI0039823E64
MNDITELALITKIKNQLKNFDTVVLKEGEALALVEALEKAQQRITQLESRTVTVKLPKKFKTSMYGTSLYEDLDILKMLTDAGIRWEAE